MIVETLDEPIKVRADFSGGVITPLAFKRKGEVFRIRRVNARWTDSEGKFKRHFFSIEARGDTFELHLDSGDMCWRLDRVCLDG